MSKYAKFFGLLILLVGSRGLGQDVKSSDLNTKHIFQDKSKTTTQIFLKKPRDERPEEITGEKFKELKFNSLLVGSELIVVNTPDGTACDLDT